MDKVELKTSANRIRGYTNKVPDARSDAGVPEDRCAIATATLTGDAPSSLTLTLTPLL